MGVVDPSAGDEVDRDRVLAGARATRRADADAQLVADGAALQLEVRDDVLGAELGEHGLLVEPRLVGGSGGHRLIRSSTCAPNGPAAASSRSAFARHSASVSVRFFVSS